MTDVAGWIAAGGSIATAVSVGLAVFQLRESRKQAKSAFEDGLSSQYRSITAELPVEVLLGSPLDDKAMAEALGVFYRYIDLSNEQIFLHDKKRVRDDTWAEWSEGIEGNFNRPAFRRAWQMIDEEITSNGHKDFEELRAFLKLLYSRHPNPAGYVS